MACRITRTHLLFPATMNINICNLIRSLIVHTFVQSVLIFYIVCNVSYAYDAKFHETLSENALRKSNNFETSLVLSGLVDNSTDDVKIKGKEPSYWFKLGSSAEDYIQIALAAEIDEGFIETVLAGVVSGYGGLAKKILIQAGLAGARNSLFSHFYNPLTDQGVPIP